MKNFLREMVDGKSKKNLAIVSSLLVLVFLFLPFNHAGATFFDELNSILDTRLIPAVVKLFFWFLKNIFLTFAIVIVNIGAWLMDVFLHPSLYEKVLTSRSINVGWTTVRDFCNMFYVFFLLLIAFATITRNQSYTAKNLLPKLIISMFLINFSMVIAKIVIDFGQVFLFGIAAWMGSFSGPTGKGAALTSIAEYFRNQFSNVESPTVSTLIVLIMAICYTGMLGFLYMILAGFLFVRLLMFVFLIIVSPFAFFSMVLPSMGTYSRQWWNSLFKNAISGPIFIFFIYLSAVLAQDLSSFTNPVVLNNLSFMSATIEILIRHGIAIGMLWMAIPVSQTLGTAGSKQMIGGTLGIGKVAMGTYAGYKLAEKTAFGAGNRLNASAKKRIPGYNDFTKTMGNVAQRTPIIKRPYIQQQAAKAEKIKMEVEEHKKMLKNLTPEQMGAYASSFTMDREKRARAQQAMLETLAEKGKLTNADLAKAGYKDGYGNFNKDKMQKEMKDIQNHGGLVDEVYKQRVDLVTDPKDMAKEVNKVVDKGEFNKLKLDVMLNDDARKEIEKLVPREQMHNWMNGKSQGEKDAYVQKRSADVANDIQFNHKDSQGNVIDLNHQKFKDFQEEAAVLSRGDEKIKRLKVVRGTKQDAKGNAFFTYTNEQGNESDVNGAKVDIDLTDRVLQKSNNKDLTDLDSSFFKEHGYLLSGNNNRYMARSGTTEQVEAIKNSINAKKSIVAASGPITINRNKSLNEDDLDKRLKAIEQTPI